jgi:hypothetical protein
MRLEVFIDAYVVQENIHCLSRKETGYFYSKNTDITVTQLSQCHM